MKRKRGTREVGGGGGDEKLLYSFSCIEYRMNAKFYIFYRVLPRISLNCTWLCTVEPHFTFYIIENLLLLLLLLLNVLSNSCNDNDDKKIDKYFLFSTL